jgi:hypothetical protein
MANILSFPKNLAEIILGTYSRKEIVHKIVLVKGPKTEKMNFILILSHLNFANRFPELHCHWSRLPPVYFHLCGGEGSVGGPAVQPRADVHLEEGRVAVPLLLLGTEPNATRAQKHLLFLFGTARFHNDVLQDIQRFD